MKNEYYKMNIKKVFSILKSSKKGLNNKEVEKRQKEYGKNTIKIKNKTSFLKLIIEQFKSYLVWLLIAIAIFAYTAGFYFHKQEQIADGIIITLIILINAFVGAYQDYKSEKAAELLKKMIKTEAIVLRNGKKTKINAEELVPGDIIYLKEGDKIPADCRIIESKELKVDESILTGESRSVLKNNKIIKKTVPIAERKNMCYMNTYIVKGTATCIVVNTGKNTEVGKIAESLEKEQKSLFLEEVDTASKKITYIALFFIIIAMTVFFLKEHSWIAVLMMASALIIGSIPEGLPAIVTFSLSMASLKLAKNNVLVKRKTLLETLGSVNVICTDKTGTLTQNKMTIKKIYSEGKIIKKNNYKKLSKTTQEELKKAALLCNEAKNTEKGFIGEAEDIALIDFFNEIGVDIITLKEKNPTINFEPFSSEKKYSKSYNKINGKIIEYTKGAPEIILEKSKYIIKEGKIKKITEKEKKTIEKKLKEFSKEALRNIAFSMKKDNKTIFLGFVGIYDPPKKDIQKTIKSIYKANIDVKMITGDNIDTAIAIAKECGFKKIKATSWEELKDLSKEDLKQKVEECNVFARMSPEYKLKIVHALHEKNYRVAITGDGVNDVPALKEADVGIAVASGSDIAKEAADLILLDDNLYSVYLGIKEGRTIFSNVRKVINYLLTANLSEVLVVFAGSLYGLMPFSAIQLLWVNFVTDIAPAMALGIDPPHKDIMKKKPTGKNEKLINKRITWLTVGIGLKKFIIMFLLFILTYKYTNNLILAQTVSFTWLVLSHFVRIAAIRFDEKVEMFNNKFLNWSLIIPIILQIIIIYTPIREFFHAVPLTIKEWIILTVAVIIAIILAKIITIIIDKNIPLKEDDY